MLMLSIITEMFLCLFFVTIFLLYLFTLVICRFYMIIFHIMYLTNSLNATSEIWKYTILGIIWFKCLLIPDVPLTMIQQAAFDFPLFLLIKYAIGWVLFTYNKMHNICYTIDMFKKYISKVEFVATGFIVKC